MGGLHTVRRDHRQRSRRRIREHLPGVLALAVLLAIAPSATGWLADVLRAAEPEPTAVVIEDGGADASTPRPVASPGDSAALVGPQPHRRRADSPDRSGAPAGGSRGDAAGQQHDPGAPPADDGSGPGDHESGAATKPDHRSPEPERDGGQGAAGEDEMDLVAVQERLRRLGFLVGPADGVEGPRTRAAVMAFQRVNGLHVDGIVGPRTLGALEDPRRPELRGGPDTRVEVDLTRQLLHLVEDGSRTATLHVSSGDGRPYTTSSGGTAYSNTPVGEFVIERRIAGRREAELGTLYDPLYFHRGWAIHGSTSVPARPASHGCIRVTRADGRWLFERVPDGTPVHVYGGEHVFVPGR